MSTIIQYVGPGTPIIYLKHCILLRFSPGKIVFPRARCTLCDRRLASPCAAEGEEDLSELEAVTEGNLSSKKVEQKQAY